MIGYWTDKPCRFLRVGSGRPPRTEQFWSLRGPPPIRGHAKDIATQMAGILALAKLRDYRCRLATRVTSGIAHALVGSNGAEGEQRSGRGQPSLAVPPTDVSLECLDISNPAGFTD